MIYLVVAAIWAVLSLGCALLLGAAIRLAERLESQPEPEPTYAPFEDAA